MTQFLAYHTWNSQFYIIREVWVYVLQPFYLKFVEWVFLNLFIRRYLKALITSTIYVPMTYYKGKPFSSIPKSLNVLRKRMYALQFHARRSICKLQTTDSNKDKRTFSSPWEADRCFIHGNCRNGNDVMGNLLTCKPR